jgi:hypothetical protein
MGGVLPLLRAKFAKPYDIFYVSFGTWHKKSQEWWNTFRPALHNLGQYYAVGALEQLQPGACKEAHWQQLINSHT